MNKEKSIYSMVLTAVFTAIIIIMAFVPYLGYIPLGFMNATIIHIPVIVGAILLGPKKGAFLGLVFGMTSLWKNTYMPNPTSFVFSPFVTIGGYGGNFTSLVICLAPRILVGVVAYYVYKGVSKIFCEKKEGKFRKFAPPAAAGVAGSLTNTLLVMNLIYIFFGQHYAEVSNKVGGSIYGFIMGIICLQGIPEAIVAGMLTAVLIKALLAVMKYDAKYH